MKLYLVNIYNDMTRCLILKDKSEIVDVDAPGAKVYEADLKYVGRIRLKVEVVKSKRRNK